MRINVYILAAVRNPALLEAALLVFKTVRIGFPTADVHIFGNALETFALQELKRASERVGASFANGPRVTHDQWIEEMLQGQTGPFWICDTDLVFFDKVESWFGEKETAIFAGRLEPEFHEEWTRTCHVERLHPALMWFNTPLVRQAMRSWMGGIPSLWHSAQMNLVRQQFIPVQAEEPLFYDTAAGLWHAVGGRPFTAEQNEAFEHLHCATYSDLVNAPGLKDLVTVHKQIFANPALARGMQREQAKYYEIRKRKEKANAL